MALQDTLNTIAEVGTIAETALGASSNPTAQKLSAAMPTLVQIGQVVAQHPQPLNLVAALFSLFQLFSQAKSS